MSPFGRLKPPNHTSCSSFVEKNATAFHSDPALREKNPSFCKLKQCGKNAGMLPFARHVRPKNSIGFLLGAFGVSLRPVVIDLPAELGQVADEVGAGDGDRTRDVQLGKLAFYR